MILILFIRYYLIKKKKKFSYHSDDVAEPLMSKLVTDHNSNILFGDLR